MKSYQVCSICGEVVRSAQYTKHFINLYRPHAKEPIDSFYKKHVVVVQPYAEVAPSPSY